MSPITYRIAACFVLTLGLAALPCCGRSKPAVSVPARPTTHPHVLTGDRFDNAQPNSLEDAYTEDDHLSYGGYDIERSFDPQKGASIATIKRDGKVLIAFRNGGQGKESTRFGLFPLIGGEARQLVIQQHTGGAHCCWIYKIYELTPNLRLLYDSELYGAGNSSYRHSPCSVKAAQKYGVAQRFCFIISIWAARNAADGRIPSCSIPR